MNTQQIDEKAVFNAARRIPDAVARDEYLAQACGSDQTAIARIRELLRIHEQEQSFLESPVTEYGATINPSPLSEQAGTVIGPYKLLQPIGEGGMGVVFMAEQTEPIQRIVALKIIKPGMDTRQVIARFEAERQAVAMMDHPNIAKVLDAGTTDSGRPYFVMELVKGVPITKYCDDKHLAIRDRLQLFVAACQAVQHAHQKGIIHRDLKPTNVLVAEYDNHAVPKVIDLGVAKATAQKLTERTMFTDFGQVLGTIEYMSPEQAKLNQLDIDTRSDIYSLGVLLYELLTGSTPFGGKHLHEAAFDEMLRIIREEEPPKPSTRLRTTDQLPSIAATRHTEPAQLSKDVHGELDWIVMKSLEKDRNRRYETAIGLARDIERYLHDEPVQACPPSKSYRFRKFARRNKRPLAAGGAIAAALVVGLGLSTWMYFRATTESARATAVSNLLQEMLGSADAARAKGADYKVRELLDDFSAGLGSQLTNEPEVEADIHATIGRAYRSLRLPDKARPHFAKAIELRRHVDGPQSEQLAAILVDCAWNLHDDQKYSDAESQLQEALEIYRQRGVTGGPLFHALQILQHVLISSGRDDEAERVTQQALAVASHTGEELPDQANLLHRYADLKIKQGNFAEGEKVARQAVDMHRRLHGERHPETGWALKTLSKALQSQQKLVEAESVLHESLAIFRRQLSADHPTIRDTMHDLRAVLESRGDKPALESLTREEAELKSRPDSPEYQVRLAGLLLWSGTPSKGALEEAHRLIRRAIEVYRRATIDSPGDFRRRMNATDGYAAAIGVCAGVPSFAGEVDEMSCLLNTELPKLVVDFPQSSQSQWETAMCYNSWGRVLRPFSDYLPTAEHAFSGTIEILDKMSLSDPNRPYVWIWLASAYAGLGDVQWRSGRPNDAEAAFGRATKIYDEHAAKIAEDIAAEPFPGISSEIILAYIEYAFYLAATHREAEAVEVVGKAALDAKHLTDPVELVKTLYFLALARLRLGDEAGYRAACKALVDVPAQSADDITKWTAIWTWCLAPAALEDLTLPVKRAEEFLAKNSLNQRHFELQLLGVALYRAGQFDRAAEQLNASIAAYPTDPLRGFDTINYTRLLLAMTKWRQGQQDEARRLLAGAQRAIDEELQLPSIQFHRLATLEVLRGEAEALIGKVPIDGAKQQENLTDKPSKP